MRPDARNWSSENTTPDGTKAVGDSLAAAGATGTEASVFCRAARTNDAAGVHAGNSVDGRYGYGGCMGAPPIAGLNHAHWYHPAGKKD